MTIAEKSDLMCVVVRVCF